VKTISVEQIVGNVKLIDLVEPMRLAFIAHAKGESSGTIGHLHPGNGEVHIKAGFFRGSPSFVVKVATGFPSNAAHGLPVWDGAMLAFDAATGAPAALLLDGGLLTDWRTAVAGAVASQALAARGARTVGIVGTGLQAFWQARAHVDVMGVKHLTVWGRDLGKAEALRQRLLPYLPDVTMKVEPRLEALVKSSAVLVTTTSSTTPLIRGEWLQPGQHLTAIGADTAEKQEIDEHAFQVARCVVVDSKEANEQYGDVGRALAQGALEPRNIVELGAVLSGTATGRTSESDISIAKLVGLGVQDLAAANVALERC
jgi:ornithine cyclodeaminase